MKRVSRVSWASTLIEQLLQAVHLDVAEMDFRAFGLQSDGAGDDVEAGCLVDELAIDLEFQISAGNFDFIAIPLARGFFGGFDFFDAFEIAEVFVVFDLLNSICGAIDAGTVEAPDVAGVLMLELCFHAFWHEGFRFAGDSEEDTAISGFAARCPTPFEAEFEIPIGRIGEQIAGRLAFADQHAVAHAPDIFFFQPIAHQHMGPILEIGAIEEVGFGAGFRGDCGWFGTGGEYDSSCESGQ